MMAHTQKPDFVFRRNGRVYLNRRGASVQSTTGSRGLRISGSNVGYTIFRGSVKGTGYALHSPVSPLLPLPCVTVCPSHFSWSLLAVTQHDRQSMHWVIPGVGLDTPYTKRSERTIRSKVLAPSLKLWNPRRIISVFTTARNISAP